jgi:hypothetical protein
MKFNVLLLAAEKVINHFWQSREVKEFVVQLLEKYSKSTDNDIDDLLVNLIRSKLLKD